MMKTIVFVVCERGGHTDDKPETLHISYCTAHYARTVHVHDHSSTVAELLRRRSSKVVVVGRRHHHGLMMLFVSAVVHLWM